MRGERATEVIDEVNEGLHLTIERGFESERAEHWWKTITENTRWYRVKYKSERFNKACETPCWTTFFGGVSPIYQPYNPVPDWLVPLVQKVSNDLKTPFNAMLIRLYFDGDDEIAWHTDGRTFLGPTPTIASLSFGANASFQMRRMTNVWPCGGEDNGIDQNCPQRNFLVGDGDMLVMRDVTQQHWHHRVPKKKGRRPRLNINFRYIIEGPDAERGQKTYYKYMVHGDDMNAESFTFKEIMAKRGGMMNFLSSSSKINNDLVTSPLSASMGHKRDSNTDKQTATVGGQQELTRNDEDADGDATKIDREMINHVAYVKNNGIDLEAFLALPEHIKKELSMEWKTKLIRKQGSVSRKRSMPSSTCMRKRKRFNGKGCTTIDFFFNKK
mmetsp:Transcript_21580/g.32766  ORF Transcript_21580/g.32766 Transcript_21580/m.32766 type:complete len:385 (-) Transcript_21580:450-1604(-)